MVQQSVQRLVAGTSRSREEAGAAADESMTGEATPAQRAAFLVALRMQGEMFAENSGIAEGMR